MVVLPQGDFDSHMAQWRAASYRLEVPSQALGPGSRLAVTIATASVVQAHIRGETPFMGGEFRMRHKDGHWIWIYSRGRVVERDAAGAPTLITGIHLDG